MPSIKDHDKRKKKQAAGKNGGHGKKQEPKMAIHDDEKQQTATELKSDEAMDAGATETVSAKSSKRRPSQLEADSAESAGESLTSTDAESSAASQAEPRPESFQSFSEADKFELNFPGSFIVKAKAPRAFDIAEKIAGDWVNDGKFESLPVGHPLAQIIASKALIKAKDVEKKVLGSAPVMLAKIGLEYAKSKIKR